jgi:hypothetical protein
MTMRGTYPLPRMDECIDSLGDADIFSALDGNCGYWQIPLAEDAWDKKTFTCHEGTCHERHDRSSGYLSSQKFDYLSYHIAGGYLEFRPHF